MGSECQPAQISSLTMLHVSHPYLVSLCHPYASFLNSQDFSFACLHSFYIQYNYIYYISVKGASFALITQKMSVVLSLPTRGEFKDLEGE